MPRRKNYQPEVTTNIWFDTQWDEGETFKAYIDVNQALSQVHRKFFKQGFNVAIKNLRFVIKSNDIDEMTNRMEISVKTLAQNWIVMNAIRKGFEEWKEQRAEVLEETGMKGRYAQFAVGLDYEHSFANNLLPYGGTYAGEWPQSDYVFKKGDPMDPTASIQALYVVGDYTEGVPGPGAKTTTTWSTDNGGLSLIKAYQDSRGLVLTPDPELPNDSNATDFADEAPWVHASMLDLGGIADEVQSLAIDEGDMPPYAVEPQFNALQLEDLLILNNYATAIGTKPTLEASTGSFAAPLGLIKLESPSINTADSNLSVGIQLELMMAPRGMGQHGIMMEECL
jgi:hypothetical protein